MQLVFVLTWHIAWELKLIHNWRTLERKTGKVRESEREREKERGGGEGEERVIKCKSRQAAKCLCNNHYRVNNKCFGESNLGPQRSCRGKIRALDHGSFLQNENVLK